MGFNTPPKTFIEAWAWLCLPSFFYCAKYTEFLGIGSWIFATAYSVFFGFVAYITYNFKKVELPIPSVRVSLGLVILGSAFAYKLVPAETLQVDRWSVIMHWWDAALKSENPYLSVSHLGNSPGPYPGLFLLYFPFYLLGETGWLWTLLVVAMVFYFRKNPLPVLLIIFIPGFLWEGLTRSNLVINGAWICFTLILPSFYKIEKVWFWALLLGIAICTRSLTLFPVAAFFWMASGKNLKSLFQNLYFFRILILALLAAAFPFMVLWISFPNFWLGFNPITFQATVFMPNIMVAGIFLLGLFTLPKENTLGLFSIFITRWLSCLFLGYWAWVCYTNGWRDAFYNSQADISYFNFVIPFGLAAMFFSCYPKADKALLMPGTKEGPSYT